MRLTLRTLLAYRDGVLDPKDAAVLQAKIQESSTAQQISQRLELDMRNRKIAPIPVDARGFGFEANQVAEFLDDTIPTELLPELERKCLENSMLLCEIGCCHQILSRALTVPATIPNSLRQRVRGLVSQPISHASHLNRIMESHGLLRRIDPGVLAAEEGASLANSAKAFDPTKASDSRESISSLKIPGSELRPSGIELNDGLGRQVPEYLIGSDRSWMKRTVFATLLLISLVVVGAYAIGPISKVRNLLKKVDKPGMVADAGVADAGVADAGVADAGVADAGVVADKKAIPTPPPVAAEPKDPVVTNELPANEDKNPTEVASAPSETAGKSSGADAPPVMDASTPEIDQGRSEVADAQAVNPKMQPITIAGSNPRMQWLPLTKESGNSIVLKRTVDPLSNLESWTRATAGQFIEIGQRVVIPPFQRTELNIEPGLRWLSASENALELLPIVDASASQHPSIAFRSGKAIVFASPKAQSLNLDCNGFQTAIQFSEPDGSMAIEVTTVLVPIDDAALVEGKLETTTIVRIYSVQGDLDYKILANEKANSPASEGKLALGQFLQWEQGKSIAIQELAETPNWFRSSVERPIDQLAIADFQKVINASPVNEIADGLLSLTGRRQAELAAIASRTRMMLGEYSSLFSADGVFNRKELRIHWQTLLGQLQLSLGTDENREKFVQKIREEVPGRANSILMLLVPKSQSQLTAGADKLLVESLSSSSLDERILAINQLTVITKKNLGYQPDKNPTETIPAWRKILSKNEIRYTESKTANKVLGE